MYFILVIFSIRHLLQKYHVSIVACYLFLCSEYLYRSYRQYIVLYIMKEVVVYLDT